MLKEYLIQNWALLLITVAFVILLKTTVFLDKKTINRMLVLVASVFVLSLVVFAEFYWNELDLYREVRTVLIFIRYSATPFILAMIIYALLQRARWFVFVPAVIFAVVNFASIYTGVVFRISDANVLQRGPLGYLPFVAVGLYCLVVVITLFRQSNRQAVEIIPIVFLCVAFASGLVLPFVLGKDYAKIFCTTIIIALFVYYVFSILQMTSKDALTGLLNRQAYYAAVDDNTKNITGVVSIDMNGLKVINDRDGHAAGDEALKTLARCFLRAGKNKQTVYRVGGDEFVAVFRRASEDEIKQFIACVKRNVAETPYSCAVGYSWADDAAKTVDEMLKESDRMMYSDKASYYSQLERSL